MNMYLDVIYEGLCLVFYDQVCATLLLFLPNGFVNPVKALSQLNI